MTEDKRRSLGESPFASDGPLYREGEFDMGHTGDLQKVLHSTDIAAIFLNRDLQIGWFTPRMKELISLGAGDIGRPLGQVACKLDGVDFECHAAEVLQTLDPIKHEVRCDDGRTFVRNVLPCGIEDGGAHGVIATFTDLSRFKAMEHELEDQRKFADQIVDTMREPLVVLDRNLVVRRTNKAFCRTFRVTSAATVGRKIYGLGNGQWDIPALRGLLEHVLPDNATFEDYEVEREIPKLGHRTMLLNARRIEHMQFILLAIEDITERKAIERRQRLLTAELNHRVKNVVATAHATMNRTLKHSRSLEEFDANFSNRLHALARSLDVLVNSNWEPSAVTRFLEFILSPHRSGNRLNIEADDIQLKPQAGLAFSMIVHELATNAVKFGALSTTDGRVEIDCHYADDDSGSVVFRWRERDGPQVRSPLRKGYGSTLIERSASHDLNGEACIEYRPNGVVCVIRFAADPPTQEYHRQ